MNNDKIRQIIARKNEQLEENAVHSARQIIDAIARLQQTKIDADKEIQSLRSELKTLEVQQVNETSILGD